MSTVLNARWATRLAVAERKEQFTLAESVSRWSREGRAAYEAKKEALLYDFSFFFYWCMVFQIRQKSDL